MYPNPLKKRRDSCARSRFQMLFNQIKSQEFELHKMTSFCRMEYNFFQRWFMYFGQKKEEKILVILWDWGFSLSLNFLSVD